MKSISLLFIFMGCLCAHSAAIEITSFHGNGELTWTNAPAAGSYAVEWASSLSGPWHRTWSSLDARVTTSTVTTVSVPMFYRVVKIQNSLLGTWQLDGFPQYDSGEFGFYNDGTFSSVFIEDSTSISDGTYSYDGNVLELNYVFSTNPNLENTTETYSGVVVSNATLTISGAIFHNALTDRSGIAGTWQWSGFPQGDTGEFVFKTDGTYTSVFLENEMSLSLGTYAYQDHQLITHCIYSSNPNLPGVVETNDFVASDNMLIHPSGIFYRQ